MACAILLAVNPIPVFSVVPEPSPEPGANAENKAPVLRAYFEGNSLTDGMNPKGLAQLAEARGRKLVFGTQIGPGMSPKSLWEKDVFTTQPYGFVRKAMAEYPWDVLTLQPFNDKTAVEIEYCLKYIELARQKNPDIQVYIYEQWPRGGGGDFVAQWLATTKGVGLGDYSRETYESVYNGVCKAAAGKNPPLLIPVGEVLHLLNQKIQAGQVPGYDNIYKFYSPDGLHLNNTGWYLAACTFYACLFRESPVGLPVAKAYEPSSISMAPITPELAKIIQETVWETVTAHPHSGAVTDKAPVVATSCLPDAVEGRRYRVEVLAGLGRPPYRWKVVKGGLPGGIVLTEEGRLSGKAEKTGETTVTIAVEDSQGHTASKEIKLRVAANSIPEIVTTELPALSQGSNVAFTFKSKGGNGQSRWSISRDKLPPGLRLQPNGLLWGSPARQGEYAFTVKATDLDLDSPNSVSKEFRGTIGAPSGPVILAPETAENIKLDGDLGKPCWTNQKFTKVEKLVGGQDPDNEVSFAAIWRPYHLYVAVKVTDKHIFINEKEPWNGDSVEIFLDAANNREQVYNFDDRRIVVTPDGKMTVFGPKEQLACAARRIDGGYTIEIDLSQHNFGSPQSEVKADSVMGLDIANNDDDNGKGRRCRVVWQGTKNNETDPSKFGTVIFQPISK